MIHVTFETAKRLKEAGFPQPTPKRGFLKTTKTHNNDQLSSRRFDYCTNWPFGLLVVDRAC
jgi:hypothetical protein